MLVDWEEGGCKEVDWRTEVSEEYPWCPILDRNGYLPVSLAEIESIFNRHCSSSCSLSDNPPNHYPSCPWASRMAQELLEAELI